MGIPELSGTSRILRGGIHAAVLYLILLYYLLSVPFLKNTGI
jgi:hypothetical protein